jgi:hypothetical protein
MYALILGRLNISAIYHSHRQDSRQLSTLLLHNQAMLTWGSSDHQSFGVVMGVSQ